MAERRLERVFGIVPLPYGDGVGNFIYEARPHALQLFPKLERKWLDWLRHAYRTNGGETCIALMEQAGCPEAAYLPAYVGLDAAKDKPQLKEGIAVLLGRMAEDIRTGNFPTYVPFEAGRLDPAPTNEESKVRMGLMACGVVLDSMPMAEHAHPFDALLGACVAAESWGPETFRAAMDEVPKEVAEKVRSDVAKHSPYMIRLFSELERAEDATRYRLRWAVGGPGTASILGTMDVKP